MAKLARILRLMTAPILNLFRLPELTPAHEKAVDAYIEALDKEELEELFPPSTPAIPFTLHEGDEPPANVKPAALIDFFRFHGRSDGVVSSTLIRAMVYHYHLQFDALSVILQSATNTVCEAINLGQDYRSYAACQRAVRFCHLAEAIRLAHREPQVQTSWLENDEACCQALRAIHNREVIVPGLPSF